MRRKHPTPLTDELVGRVRAINKRHCGYFHLAPCTACGCPTFQEPCPTCGYYANWNNLKHDREDRARRFELELGRKEWLEAVERAGSVAAWYIASKKQNIAYCGERVNGIVQVKTVSWEYRDIVHALEAEVASHSWPSPEAIFDEVSAPWGDVRAFAHGGDIDPRVERHMSDEQLRYVEEIQASRTSHLEVG